MWRLKARQAMCQSKWVVGSRKMAYEGIKTTEGLADRDCHCRSSSKCGGHPKCCRRRKFIILSGKANAGKSRASAVQGDLYDGLMAMEG